MPAETILNPDENCMRALLLLTLCCVSYAVGATELPAGRVGESCREVAERELRAGRAPQYDLEAMRKSGYLLFAGKADSGGSLQTLFHCTHPGGDLLGYSVRLSQPSEALAREAYNHARERLIEQFGAPRSDSESLALPQRIRRWRAFGATYSTMELVQWTTASRSPSLAIEKLRADPQWRIVVSDQPPAEGGSAGSAAGLASQWSRVLVVALSSAAIAAALCLTRLARFRWVIAVVTPMAAAEASSLLLRWNPEEALAGRGAAAAALGFSFLSGLLASAMAIWGARRFGAGLAPSPAAPKPYASGLLLAAIVVLIALAGWLAWQFAPGRDPGNPAAGLALKWVFCLAGLLLATALALVGTAGLPSVALGSDGEHGTVWQKALPIAAVAGSAALVTLCLHLAAEFALAL